MANSRYQNRIQAYNALLIYHDAMIPFIEEALGPERIYSELFSDVAKNRDPRKYERGMRELDEGKAAFEIMDPADIPHLVGNNLNRFSGLNHQDVDQMHSILEFWNDLKHNTDPKYFHPEDTADSMARCEHVLQRCGLNKAADEIAGLSSPTPAISASAPVVAARKLTRPGYDIKPPRDLFAADTNPQLRRQAEFTRLVQHRLASSMSHDLVLREDGSVAGWGKNHYGQCSAPVGKFIAVSAGKYHSLGLLEDSSITGWGDDISGQCKVPRGRFRAVSAGGYHSLGLREDGSVAGWGDNRFGQCATPDGKFIAISAGEYHSLGLREDGSIASWGDNRFRQCATPDGKFVAVSAGGYHSLGLREDGSIAGWGDNRFRQCAAPDGKFVAVSAGEYHSLGLREDGSVAGWGDNNDGQRNAPDDKFIAVSAGGYHNLGLREDGSLARWGWQSDEEDRLSEGHTSRD